MSANVMNCKLSWQLRHKLACNQMVLRVAQLSPSIFFVFFCVFSFPVLLHTHKEELKQEDKDRKCCTNSQDHKRKNNVLQLNLLQRLLFGRHFSASFEDMSSLK